MRATPPPPGRVLVPLLLGAALLAPAPAPAQLRPAAPPAKAEVRIPPDGTDLFRALLDRTGVKPVKQQEVRGLTRWDDVMVVVLGDPTAGPLNFNLLNHVQDVLAAGGAALVASDTALDLSGFSGWRGGIEPARVRCRDPGSVLPVPTGGGGVERRPDCPYVVPLTPADRRLAPPPETPLGGVFGGLARVAANGSSYIRLDGFGGAARRPLARFPRGCTATWRADRFREFPLPDDALFAVGGHGPDGGNDEPYRFLVMADHSVFINQMLVEPGTENLELAHRVIEYLRGPERRDRCLFVENGRVVEQFDGLRKAFAKPKPPLPTPNLDGIQEKLIDFGNAVVDDVQTRNVPNNILTGAFGLPAIVRFLIVVGAVYAAWFLLRRMFSARKPTDVPPPPAVPGAPAGPPGVFDRRQKELLRRDNLYEPARDLVREFFAGVGAGGPPGARHPRVAVAPAVRKPDSLRQAVKDFWALAYGPPKELPAARWREMEPYLDRLRRAHADGKWRFEPAAAPV